MSSLYAIGETNQPIIDSNRLKITEPEENMGLKPHVLDKVF